MIRMLAALFLAAAAFSASADEASVKRAVEARFGGVKVDSVARTPYSGLYEVVIGDEIIYTDEKVSYIFTGNIIDASTRRNLTEERQQRLLSVNFNELPLDQAIKTVRGSGKRVMVIFADPRCPYCKQFEENLYKMSDVTIYTVLYPILGENSVEIARNIWCSPDPSRAWLDTMLKGVLPPAKICVTPIDKNLKLGARLRVTGTPTTFLPSGQRIVGARFTDLARALDEGSK
jgi:thiol:disulfide interchange protein DsbC